MNSQNQTLVGVSKTCLEGGNGKRERENGAAQRIFVELASYGQHPFLPPKAQPLVSSFYYWNMLTYSRTNRSISISIRLRSLNLCLGISVVIVSPPICGVNHMVRWESGI